MAKLTLSQPGMSFSLNLSVDVLTEYLKHDVKDLDLSQKMTLVTKLVKELSNGYRENLHNGRGGSLVSESGETNLRGVLQTNDKGNDRNGKNGSITQNNSGVEASEGSHKRVAIDPDLTQIALDLTEMIFDEGCVKFSDYAAQMIEGIGDEVKPLLKGFYELARYTPGMEGIEKMSTSKEVAGFNINKFNHKEYFSDKSKSTISTGISTL